MNLSTYESKFGKRVVKHLEHDVLPITIPCPTTHFAKAKLRVHRSEDGPATHESYMPRHPSRIKNEQKRNHALKGGCLIRRIGAIDETLFNLTQRERYELNEHGPVGKEKAPNVFSKNTMKALTNKKY